MTGGAGSVSVVAAAARGRVSELAYRRRLEPRRIAGPFCLTATGTRRPKKASSIAPGSSACATRKRKVFVIVCCVRMVSRLDFRLGRYESVRPLPILRTRRAPRSANGLLSAQWDSTWSSSFNWLFCGSSGLLLR